MSNLIIITEKTGKGRWHKYTISDFGVGSWDIASFDTEKQFNRFCNMLGITYTVVETRESMHYGKMIVAYTDKIIRDADGSHFNWNDLPKTAKPFKAYSNGSIVDCFFDTTDTEILIYRPNPNSKDIYKPLSLSNAIEFHREFGCY